MEVRQDGTKRGKHHSVLNALPLFHLPVVSCEDGLMKVDIGSIWLDYGTGECRMVDCFNYSCPFRVNESSNANRCECLACPNRCTGDFFISWNRTLTDEEMGIIKRIADDHERRWSE